MKPSGIEWIGDIPDDWEVIKTKFLFNVYGGSTPKVNVSEYWGDKITWITPGELGDDIKIVLNSKRMLSEKGLNSCGATLVSKGSIIISNRAPIGQVCLAGSELCTNQGCKSLVAKIKLSCLFFYYFFKVQSEVLNMLGNGTTFMELSTSDLLNFKIPFPTIKEQQKIADYLDEKCGEIDATIAKQKESIEKLKAYKQSLISETVTKGLDKSAPLKPSGIDYLGDIPSHWEIKKLKFVANFNQNTLPEDTDGQFELKYIDIGNVSSVDGIKEIQYFNFSNAPSRARRIVKYGDIIVSTVRTYLRAITSIKEDYDNCICSTGFAVITPKDNVQQDFVVYAIENESFIAQIIANSQGISYPAINVSQLENLKLAFPSVKEQKEIVDFLKTKLLEIDLTINKKQNIIQKLDAYKKSLIFECITGKHKIY